MSRDLLTLERFAEVLAHHEHFGHERADEICRRLRVDDVWDESMAHWSSMLHENALSMSEERQLATTFAKSLEETKSKLNDEDPKLEDIGELTEDSTAPPRELEASPPSPPAGAHPPAMVDPSASPIAPLPGAGAPPSATAVPRSAAVQTRSGQSAWAKGQPEPAAVVAPPAPVPPAVVEAPALAGAAVNIDETAFVTAIDFDDPLPFAGRSDAAPEPVEASELLDAAGLTREMPAVLAGNETLPFLEGLALGIEEEILETLTIEQYASLTAELAVRPDRAATLRRYGVDENTFEILGEAWRRKLQADPPEQQRFSQLVESYRAWLGRHHPPTT